MALDGIAGFLNIIFNPLVEQLAFVVNASDAVEDLKKQFTILKDKYSDVKKEVEEAERDPSRRRTQVVNGWLQRVESTESEVSAIKAKFEQRCRCFGGRCSANVYSSYNIGRKATRKLAVVKDLQGRDLGSSLTFEFAPHAQRMPVPSNMQGTAMESNLQKVLDYLESGVGIVGIVGMGGVGKTCLLKKINEELARRHAPANHSSSSSSGVHFDHVIWAVVSRDASPQKLQEQIAESLMLPSTKRDTIAIFNFLNGKRFLLLLDDVWSRLELDKMRIPNGGRTVIFTTRSKQVCGQMAAGRHVVEVGCLNEEEAWSLFEQKVGKENPCLSRPEILKLAKEISKECKGLPLALVTIGRAMSDKTTPQVWRHARDSIRKSQLPSVIPEAKDALFPLLKLSYDSLPDHKTQQCFLLCALFPEDYAFRKDELNQLLWGVGLIKAEEFGDVGELYNEGHFIIATLQSACLLGTPFNNEHFVQMHDILRDMALWIARDRGQNSTKWIVRFGLNSREPLRGVHNWELADRISLMGNNMVTFPEPAQNGKNLISLHLQRNYDLERFPMNFFRRFTTLTCLDLSRTGITELPEDVVALVELRYLDLSFSKIKSLSKNSSALTKLNHLILMLCEDLIHIPHGLISNFPALQNFNMFGSGFVFGIVDMQENINVKDTTEERLAVLAATNELEKSMVGNLGNIEELKKLKGKIKALGLNVALPTISLLGEFVDLSSICFLKVIGLPAGSNLHNIDVEISEPTSSSNFEDFLITTDGQKWHFQVLRGLWLIGFDNLIITWKRLELSTLFPCLEALTLVSCHSLRDLTWIQYLPLLTLLAVVNCNGLEQIISDEDDYDHNMKDYKFPRTGGNIFLSLERIKLECLPMLHNICATTLDAPLLRKVIVVQCPNLKRLPFSFAAQMSNKLLLPMKIEVGEQEWWDGLEWEDETIKGYLQKYLRYI